MPAVAVPTNLTDDPSNKVSLAPVTLRTSSASADRTAGAEISDPGINRTSPYRPNASSAAKILESATMRIGLVKKQDGLSGQAWTPGQGGEFGPVRLRTALNLASLCLRGQFTRPAVRLCAAFTTKHGSPR